MFENNETFRIIESFICWLFNINKVRLIVIEFNFGTMKVKKRSRMTKTGTQLFSFYDVTQYVFYETTVNKRMKIACVLLLRFEFHFAFSLISYKTFLKCEALLN